MDKNLSVSKKIQKLFQSDYKYAVYIRELVSYFVYSSEEYKRTENRKYLDLKEYLLEIIKKQIASFETYHENNQVLFKQIFNVEEVDIKLLSSSRNIPRKLPKEIETNIDIRVTNMEEMFLELDERFSRLEKDFFKIDKKYKTTREYAVEVYLNYVKKYLRRPGCSELEKFCGNEISDSEWSRNLDDPIFISILEKEFTKLINKSSIKENLESYEIIFQEVISIYTDKLISKIRDSETTLIDDIDVTIREKLLYAIHKPGAMDEIYPKTKED